MKRKLEQANGVCCLLEPNHGVSVARELLHRWRETAALNHLDVIGSIPSNLSIDFPTAALNDAANTSTTAKPDNATQVHIASHGSERDHELSFAV
jgi:hypothetical protein